VKTLLEITGPNHEHMIKEAVIGAMMNMGKVVGGVGKAIVKNPLKTFGYVATGADALAGANKLRGISPPGMSAVTDFSRRTM